MFAFALGETGTQLFSEIYKGTKSYTKSSYGETKSSDRNFAAVEATIEKIAQDESFRNVLVGKPLEKTSIDGFVEVDFSPKPDNCDVEIDGKYIGGSPLKKRLLAGKEYKIRFSKNGFKDWTGTISPEVGQRITKELEASR